MPVLALVERPSSSAYLPGGCRTRFANEIVADVEPSRTVVDSIKYDHMLAYMSAFTRCLKHYKSYINKQSCDCTICISLCPFRSNGDGRTEPERKCVRVSADVCLEYIPVHL